MANERAIPVCYDERMVVRDNPSASPSAGKPAEVVEAWLALQDPQTGAPLIRLEPVEPVGQADLALAHSTAYVRGILSGKRINGFANRVPEVAASLTWTVGSMVTATFVANEERGPAVAPVSGFHHAEYERAMGFCTFNGLIVAARIARREGLAKRVGILDLDAHYGNGTDHIISTLRLEDWIHHFTLGARYWSAEQAETFFSRFPELLRAFDDCDLVLAQMGADPWVGDPVGGGIFTTEQMRQRDRMVFEHFAATGQPLAWNLAGGYARDEDGTIAPVLMLHNITLEECHRAYQSRRS